MFLLSLLACETGSLTLDDGKTDDLVDDTGAAEEEEEPVIHPFSGEYTGTIAIEGSSWDLCAGEGEFVVDEEDGSFDTVFECTSGSGWGGEYPVQITGSVDDDGEISGDVVIEVSWGGEGDGSILESDLDGSAGDTDFEATWVTELDWGEGGGTAFDGSLVAERE